MKKFGRLTAILSVSAIVLSTVGVIATSASAQSQVSANGNPSSSLSDGLPSQRGMRLAGSASTAAVVPISYAGGAVMTNPVNVYVVWYGKWTGATTSAGQKTSSAASKALIQHFLKNIGGSPYYNTNTTYYSGSSSAPTYVSGAVNFVAETFNTSTTNLTDSGVLAAVNKAITANAWKVPGTNTAYTTTATNDPNGLYFVLSSAGIGETSGFLTNYCGWHYWSGASTPKLKYSFVGDASKSIRSCAGQTTSSPNTTPTQNLVAADAMISVIVHELEEANTDPEGGGWYDASGAENADKCAWNFGTTQTASNGSKFNITLGTTEVKNYLVQQNWLASTQACALALPQ